MWLVRNSNPLPIRTPLTNTIVADVKTSKLLIARHILRRLGMDWVHTAQRRRHYLKALFMLELNSLAAAFMIRSMKPAGLKRYTQGT